MSVGLSYHSFVSPWSTGDVFLFTPAARWRFTWWCSCALVIGFAPTDKNLGTMLRWPLAACQHRALLCRPHLRWTMRVGTYLLPTTCSIYQTRVEQPNRPRANTLAPGAVRDWGERGDEGDDTYFPSTVAEAPGPSRRYEQDYYGGTAAAESWRRTGSAIGTPGVNSFEEDGAGGGRDTGSARAVAGLVWPAQRASSSAAYGSRGKQS